MNNNVSRNTNIINHLLKREGLSPSSFETLWNIPLPHTLKAFVDKRRQLKAFHGVNGKYPSEIVSKIDKAKLKKELISSVRAYFFESGVPYVHIWYYPKNYKTLFSFRVDSDGFERESFYKTFRLAQEHHIRMNWFIDVKSHKNHFEDVVILCEAGQEVQVHCYEHRVYADFQRNYENILKAKQIMEEEARIEVIGFAAPHGIWNEMLNEALEKLNFIYSSEFSIGYDDFPFFPIVGDVSSRVLQIPIHPICIGSLLEAGFTEDEMKDYFRRIIDYKYSKREPIIFYGHPKGRIGNYPSVIDFIFSYIKGKEDVWYPTFSKYAEWWKNRLSVDFRVQFDNGKLIIETNNTDERFHLAVELPDERQTIIPLIQSRVDMENLLWEPLKRTQSNCSSVETKEFGIKLLLMKRKLQKMLRSSHTGVAKILGNFDE